jgi:hypothetical protein
MQSLFPSWKGTFSSCRPTLAGVPNNPSISNTLQTGLLTPADLSSLQHLIRSPDAPFLKVPALPFWSLVSVLRKFPVDCDSRVFWGREVRDGLFDVLFGALGVLMGRIERGEGEEMELVREMFEAGMHCEGLLLLSLRYSRLYTDWMYFTAFTSQQITTLTALIDNTPYSYGTSPPSSPLLHLRTSETHRYPHQSLAQAQIQAQEQIMRHPNTNGYAEVLAREFGVEAQLVEALAQRLAAFQ